MSFLKLRCDRAYLTGAVRTNLPLRDLARKLTRAGLPAEVANEALTVRRGGDRWVFDQWREQGLSNVGWLRFTTDGDIGGLSRALAELGIRHRFEHSRPADVDVDDVRCVTSYDHLWESPRIGVHRAAAATITTFEERL